MKLVGQVGKSGSAGIIVFVVIALCSMLVPLSIGTASLGDNARNRLIESSHLTASTIDAEFSSVSATVRSTAQELNETANIEPAYIKRRISALRSSHPAIRTAVFLDMSGSVVASEGATERPGTNYSNRPYFRAAVEHPTSMNISNPFISTLAGSVTVVAVSTQVFSPGAAGQSGHARGVLMAAIDVAQTFEPLIGIFNGNDGIEAALFDGEARRFVGTSSLATDPTVVSRLKQMNNNAQGGAPAARSGVSASESGKYVYSIAPIANTSFFVVASADKSKIFAPLHAFESRMIYMNILIATGAIVGLALMYVASRKRDRAEEKLKTASARTQSILDSATQAFVECDSSGRISAWNVAAERLFAIPIDEALGRDFSLLVVADGSRELFRRAFPTVSGSSHHDAPDDSWLMPEKRQMTLVVPETRETFAAQVTSWTTEVENRRTRCFFIEDVTQQNQLEAARELVLKRQRELVEELRLADQAKSDFMSTVSHELRTPLTSIVGYVEMLHEGYGGKLDNSAESMLGVIDRNAQRLLMMIEDLLTLSRIEAGFDKPEISTVDIGYLAKSVGDALLPQAREHKLQFDVQVQPDLPSVKGDPHQLERVMINLVSNAVKFTPDGGKVALKVCKNGSNQISIKVSDTGIGIPKAEQHKLFNRFFRSSTARSKAIQGTGLGLAIVKGIVDRHGGSISLESEDGQGTTAEILLPTSARQLSGV